MKKRYKIILSILLPIVCITSVCLSFLLPVKNKNNEIVNEKTINKTRYEANYFASADEESPSLGQSALYKGGSIFLEPNSVFTMSGGTISGHTNTYGGAVYVSANATFIMEAGLISGCRGAYGGAIYVESGGICNIIGGTITGNAANYGPSIYAEAGARIKIGGDANISGNDILTSSNVSISTDAIAVGDPSEGLSFRYVDFGSYPQTYAGDDMNTTLEDWFLTSEPVMIDTYKVRTRTWSAYLYTDGNVYVRGLSYICTTGNRYQNGQDVKGNDEVVWFRIEPIRWIILNYDAFVNGSSSNLEIMSYLALASDISFNDIDVDSDGVAGTSDDPNRWETSDLRLWLNDTFYNSAFTSAERDLIAKVTVKNNITAKQTDNDSGGVTEDKIYCLSYWDLYHNNSSGFFNTKGKRLCCPTDFTISNYVFVRDQIEYVTATRPTGGVCDFWARSAGSYPYFACYVDTLGSLLDFNNTVAVKTTGVRPVLQLAV